MRSRLAKLAATLLVLFLLIQLVPYGRDHTNPPVVQEPVWNSTETRALAQRACFDCHSNETVWEWYHNIAPASWLVQRDVEEAREHMNFSEWHRPQENADEAAEMVAARKMPLPQYLLVHPAARLNAVERAALVEGLLATLGGDGEGEEEEDEGDDDEDADRD